MTTENTKEVLADMELIENDPVMKAAVELSKKDVETTEQLVNELLTICMKKVDNDGMMTKHVFMSLSKALIYMTQTLCTDQEHFQQELAAANALVIRNVFPALGANSHDEELNKNSEVTFNGTFNEENFNIRRLMMLSGALVDYSYWKTNFNAAVSEQIEKDRLAEEKAKENKEEI